MSEEGKMGIAEMLALAMAAKNVIVEIVKLVDSSDNMTAMEKEEFKEKVGLARDLPPEWL
jgi:hypothetical protein